MPPSGDEPDDKLQILVQEDFTNLNLEQHCDLYPHSSNSSNNNEKDEQYFIGKYMNCNLNEKEEESSSFSPLDVQIDKFICDSLLTQEHYSTCMKMLEELQKVLDFGTIKPFGSFLMGLANSDSDVDVSFETSDQISSAKLFDKVFNALQNAKVASTDGGQNQNYTRKIKPYKIVRVPFIRFTPFSFSIKCDLSFENTLGAENSRLILFLFSLNPVMRPLTILVKKWAQLYKLCNSQGLKGYAIALLVIFFMVRKKNLPSIHLLQSLVPTKIVDGHWNVAFCTDVHLIQAEMEKMGIKSPTLNHPRELIPYMVEFFDMLTNLSPDSVICTLSGEFIKNDDFIPGKEDRLPPSQAQFIEMRKMTKIKHKKFSSKRLCLQDPFDLAYNVMEYCSILPKIQNAIKDTVGRLHGNFLETNPSFTSLFLLISTKGRKIRNQHNIEFTAVTQQIYSSYNKELECFSFQLSPQPSFFELARLSSMSKSDLYELWYKLALEFLNTRISSCFNSFHHSEPKKEITDKNNSKQKFSTTFQLSIRQKSNYFKSMNLNVDEQQKQPGKTKTRNEIDELPPFFRFSCRFEYENEGNNEIKPKIIVTLTQLTMTSDNSTMKVPMRAVGNAMKTVISGQLGWFVEKFFKGKNGNGKKTPAPTPKKKVPELEIEKKTEEN